MRPSPAGHLLFGGGLARPGSAVSAGLMGGGVDVLATDALPGVEVRTGVMRQSVPLHFHGCHEIGLIEAGEGRLTRRGEALALRAGCLVLIGPGEPHAVEVARGDMLAARVLHVPAAWVEEVSQRLPGRPRLPRFAVIAPGGAGSDDLLRVVDQLSATERAAGLDEPFRRALGELLRAHGVSGAELTPGLREAVRRARQHLDACLDTRVSLEELGRLTGLSRFHLARAFTAEVGMPPHAYLAQVRVLFAKTLVRAGYPLREVAARCGFADQSHLSREFKRLTQVTPGRYARALRGLR